MEQRKKKKLYIFQDQNKTCYFAAYKLWWGSHIHMLLSLIRRFKYFNLSVSSAWCIVVALLSNISVVMNAVKTYKNTRSRIQREEFTWSRFIETAASAMAFMDRGIRPRQNLMALKTAMVVKAWK